MSKAPSKSRSKAQEQAKAKGRGDQVVIRNRRARYDYELLDTFECGIMLDGPEVKSIRAGHANLQEAYARIEGGEVFLHGMHVRPYEFAQGEPDPVRSRKRLLHRSEIEQLSRMSEEKGMTLVPTRVYFSNGRVKVEIAPGRGKRQYDKRHAIKEREANREADRAIRDAQRR